jgi:hypothetical protein
VSFPRAWEIVSTRRITKRGTVHEMAEVGVKTLCERDLPEPWEWTDAIVSCRQCLAALRIQENQP